MAILYDIYISKSAAFYYNFCSKKVKIAKDILEKNDFAIGTPVASIYIYNCFVHITIFIRRKAKSWPSVILCYYMFNISAINILNFSLFPLYYNIYKQKSQKLAVISKSADISLANILLVYLAIAIAPISRFL